MASLSAAVLVWLLRAVLPEAPVTIVVASPDGAVCRLDPATGARLASIEASATDVLADASGGVWTVEPGSEADGRLARYRVTAAGLALERELTFGALDGRILVATDEPIVLGLADGATLSVAKETGAWGLAWPTPSSALVTSDRGVLQIATLDDATRPWRVRRARLVDGALAATDAVSVDTPIAPCGGRMVAGASGVALVAAGEGEVTVSERGRVVARAVVPQGACVEDAIRLPDGEIAALVGPTPAIILLGSIRAFVLPLAFPDLPHAPWLSHRLAYDPSRRRLWAAIDSALLAVDLYPTPALSELSSGCAATAVTLAKRVSAP